MCPYSVKMEYSNYENALLPVLRKIAKDESLIGYSTMKKNKLRETLRAHFTSGDIYNMYKVSRLKELCKNVNIYKIPNKKVDIISLLRRCGYTQVLPGEIFALIAHYSVQNKNTKSYDSIFQLSKSINNWVKSNREDRKEREEINMVEYTREYHSGTFAGYLRPSFHTKYLLTKSVAVWKYKLSLRPISIYTAPIEIIRNDEIQRHLFNIKTSGLWNFVSKRIEPEEISYEATRVAIQHNHTVLLRMPNKYKKCSELYLDALSTNPKAYSMAQNYYMDFIRNVPGFSESLMTIAISKMSKHYKNTGVVNIVANIISSICSLTSTPTPTPTHYLYTIRQLKEIRPYIFV